MSAARSASALLFALLSTIVLFAVFVGVTSLPLLSSHSYGLDYGWETQQSSVSPGGICDRPLTTKGFPMTTRRPAADPAGCLDSINPLAKYMNLALCFAAAAIISVGMAGAYRNRP